MEASDGYIEGRLILPAGYDDGQRTSQIKSVSRLFAVPPNADLRVRSAIRFMSSAPPLMLSAEELAKRVGLSRSRFEHLFRENLGVSLGQWQRGIRLRTSMRLLADPRLRVKQIAAECGYACVQDFTRAFKAAFGVSPIRYRNSLSG
jgi:AraC family transcriptional regulator